MAQKANSYVLLSFKGDDIKVIKEYAQIKSKVLKLRQDKDINNDTQRYLMRFGLEKFVINVADNEIVDIISL